METRLIMITLNPFNLMQTVTVHTPEQQYSTQYIMEDVFNAALAIGEEQGIYNIKVATISFPKEYSEKLANTARIAATQKYGENKFEIEVL